MKKNGRADIRLNKEIKEVMAELDTSPQKIVDAWIKRNLKKLKKLLKRG